MAQPQPTRPILRRQSSKVRFSRGDNMSPVGTMVSDSDLRPGVGPAQQSTTANNNGNQQAAVYDVNSYPFEVTTEISLSQSQDRGRDVPEDQVPLNPYAQQDHYTATPPRPSTVRRSTGPVPVPGIQAPVHRPTLDALVPGPYGSAEISPRNTTGVDSYEMPPVHNSPAQRPSSVLRPSIVANYPSPQRAEQAEYQPPQGSPRAARPSMPPQSPAQQAQRRMYDQHQAQHRPSAPAVMGSPRESPRPDTYTQYRPSVAPGYRRNEYEERSGITPGPTYGSPRHGYFERPHYGPTHDYGHGHSYGQPQDGRYRRLEDEPVERGRYDSDATLQGDAYDEKYRKPSGGAPPPRRPRSMSDTSDPRHMHRKSTKDFEDAEEGTYTVKGGIFSQLLRLGRGNNTMRRRQSSRGIALSSRGTSACGDELPTMQTLGLKKIGSTASTTYGGDELDEEDPRVTGQKPARRRSSFSDMLFKGSQMGEDGMAGRRKRRASIQKHVACE